MSSNAMHYHRVCMHCMEAVHEAGRGINASSTKHCSSPDELSLPRRYAQDQKGAENKWEEDSAEKSWEKNEHQESGQVGGRGHLVRAKPWSPRSWLLGCCPASLHGHCCFMAVLAPPSQWCSSCPSKFAPDFHSSRWEYCYSTYPLRYWYRSVLIFHTAQPIRKPVQCEQPTKKYV